MPNIRKSLVDMAKEEHYTKGYIAGCLGGYVHNYLAHTGSHALRDMLLSLPDDLIRFHLEKVKPEWSHLPIERPKEDVGFFYIHLAPDMTEDPDLVTLKDIKLPLTVEVSGKPRDMGAHPSVCHYKDCLYLIIHEWCTPILGLARAIREGKSSLSMDKFNKYILEAMQLISDTTLLDQFVQVGGYDAIKTHVSMYV